MAGSYKLLTVAGEFSAELIETIGDASEALEECHYLIGWLADQLAKELHCPGQKTIDELIDEALAEFYKEKG